MQGANGRLAILDQEEFGKRLEEEYLKEGLFWGRMGSKPKNYTARIGMEAYVLRDGEVETLKHLENLIPKFLKGCVDLARRSMLGEYPWLWQNLCFGRSDLQVAIWEKELRRQDIILAKRIRIDVIRTKDGLKINEFTLGATGSGYGAVIDVISRKYFSDQKFFEPIAKKYVDAIHELLPNGGCVGVLLTPWRELYGPEQLALTVMLNKYGKKFGLEFKFGLTFEAEVKNDGVYLGRKRLDLVERVFKEYSEKSGQGSSKDRLTDYAVKIEKQIIDVYFAGKVLLHPNLLTFLDYKELMAWLFDERLEKEWEKFLGIDDLKELRNIFAYTVVWKGDDFVWQNEKYVFESLQELSDLQIREYWFAFCESELIEFRESGGAKSLELGKKLVQSLGDLDVLKGVAKSSRKWTVVDSQLTVQVALLRNSEREVLVMSGRKNWFVKIRQLKKKLETNIVLKLSGGDNKAAGGHAVVISKDMIKSVWRKQVVNFSKMAKERTVIAQEYCKMEVDELMVFDPALKKTTKDKVRTRICVWYWLDSDLRKSSFGGNTVTCIPISDGYIVHGRSNSAMTSCSLEQDLTASPKRR